MHNWSWNSKYIFNKSFLIFQDQGGIFLEKDRTLKALLSNKDIYSSLINTFVFRGECIIQSKQILFLNIQGKLHLKNSFRYFDRDLFALILNKENRPWFLIGFENQSVIDPNMDIRNLVYDATAWQYQLLRIRETRWKKREAKKEGKPVQLSFEDLEHRLRCITIVLYYGTKPWNMKSWKERLPGDDKNLQRFDQDYKIFIESMAFLDDKTKASLHPDIRLIAQYLEQKRLGTEDILFSPGTKIILAETLDVLRAFSDDRAVQNVLDTIIAKEKKKSTKGGIDMASAFEMYINERLETGIRIGVKNGIEQWKAGMEEQLRKAEESISQAQEKSRLAQEESRLAQEESRLAQEESRQAQEESLKAKQESRLAQEASRQAQLMAGEAISTLVILAQRSMVIEGLSAQEACDRLLLKGKLREQVMQYLVS